MKYVSHLVAADIRRSRLLLGLWVSIEIANTVLLGVRPTLPANPSVMRAVDLLAMVLFLSRWLGMIVVVPLVMQTHPLVGSDAFWMTRPIPWRSLFASKVVLLGTTFVAVPALCELVLMLASRVRATEIPLVSLQTILFQSLWLVIVMALSAMTRNLARFALVVGSALVGLVLLMNAAIAIMMRTLADGPQMTLVERRSTSSSAAGLVMLVLLIIAGVVTLVVQYRTRSTRRSVGVGLSTVAVAILVMLTWPSQEQPVAIPAWAGDPTVLQLVATSQQGQFRPLEGWSHWGRSDGWQIGTVRLALREISEGWLVTVRLADSTVRFDDGTILTTVGNGFQSVVPFASSGDAPLRAVIRQVLGVDRVLEGAQGHFFDDGVPAIVLSHADFKTRAGATGAYRGRFLVDLDQITIAAALPLQAGAEFREHRRRIVVDQIIPRTQSAAVRVRQFTATTTLDSDAGPRVSFYLRNRIRGEAVAGSGHQGIAPSMGARLPLSVGVSAYSVRPTGSFSATSEFIRFPDGYTTDVQQIDINADWLSQAELVIVHTVSAGSVSRTVDIPGFAIAAATPFRPK